MHRLAFVPLLALVCGCNSLLGIEKLKPGPELDAGSRPDAQLDAGGTQEQGGKPAGGTGGSAEAGSGGRAAVSGAGGSAEAGSGGRTAGAGGMAGSGGRSAGGSGGASGQGGAAGQGSSGTVHGRVIDFRRNAVPDLAVRIGDQTVRTDADGRFMVDAVPATYDVTLSIHTTINNAQARHGWQVQGLTRRDPTLQVYRALLQRSAEVVFQTMNVSDPLPAGRHIAVTWASPLGEQQTEMSSPGSLTTSATWIGAASSAGNAHALMYDVSSSPEVPTAYIAHDTHPITLQDGAQNVAIPFDLTAQSIAADTLSGTFSGPRDNRRLHVFLRFADDTSLALPYIAPTTDTFSYLVPKLSGASYTVLFENANNGRDNGQSGMFVDNVMPGQSDLSLSLPAIPTQSAPAPGKTAVTGDTEFAWDGSAKLFLVCSESVNYYEGACVLTSKKSSRLPVAPLSDYVPTANEPFLWTVETHGSFASVDEASGENGFLSAGYRFDTLPQLPRGSGSYAISASWGFTTAP